jgi:hypothetical protein
MTILSSHDKKQFQKLPTLSAKKEFVRELRHIDQQIALAKAEDDEREYAYWREIDRRIDEARGK